MLPENCFLLSRDNTAEVSGSQLFGYGIAEDAVILGTGGLTEYFAAGHRSLPEDGRFCGIFAEAPDEIVVRTDVTGQEMLYLYQNGDDWAVSNSFLLLAQAAAARGKLHAYAPAIACFHLKKGTQIGEQLISHRTMTQEISIVPLTAEVRIDRRTQKLAVHSRSCFDVFSLGAARDYQATLIDMLEQGAGLLQAMSQAGYSTNLFLSGGYDSRLALCMALAGDISTDRIRISSIETKQDDLRVATSICTRLGLPLNGPGPQTERTLSESDAIRTYLLSCGGTYLPFYPIRSHFVQDGAVLRVTGDQPTAWNFFGGRARFNGSADKIRRDIMNDLEPRGFGVPVAQDFMSTFSDLDLDPEHPGAMAAYYSATRSRHHCGRSWYRSLGAEFLVTPLMHKSFVALDMHNMASGFDPRKIFADAFSAFGGWALEEAFETPDRAFGGDLLAQSPFKGGAKIAPRPYKIFGRLQAGRVDAPDLFSLDLRFNARPETIKPKLAELFHVSDRARLSEYFSAQDIGSVKAEMRSDGSLSHDHRRLCHLISTDLVLSLVESSGAAFST